MLLQHLITFCKVVETGSFTRAAEALHLSQPSVTKHISSLEHHLGVVLLDRDGKRVHLTPAGELVYDYARRIAQQVAECQAAVQALRDPRAGMVTVGCVHTIGLYVLPDLLLAFAREYPQVRLIVKTSRMQETLRLLLQHEIDLGLVTAPVTHERVSCTPLYEDPVLVVGSPRLRSQLPPEMTAADLARVPVIGFQRGTRYRTFLDSELEKRGIHLSVVMEFDSHEAVRTMAALGLGLALAPASTVRRDLQEGTLVEVPVRDFPRISRTTCLILRRDGRLPPAAANLARFIARHFGVPEPEPLG
ncbi:MAG: LysR family transcriptional regulator [Bacillota bacterium]|nr:MAG: hypothetical protein DIU70_04395 [Bacillota bacterium]